MTNLDDKFTLGGASQSLNPFNGGKFGNYTGLVPQIPSPKLILTTFGLSRLKEVFYTVGTEAQDKAIATSMLGTPVFSNLEIQGGKYKSDDGKETLRFIGFEPANSAPELKAINTVLFEVNQSKNIVRTEVQGRSGTVKEYISNGDFEVTVRGALVDPNALVYPEQQVKVLKEILDAPVALAVNSKFLGLFGIYSLVVQSVTWKQIEGFHNVQFFEFRAWSDTPIELTSAKER